MKTKMLFSVYILFFLNVINLAELKSQIINNIVVKVGGLLISSVDVQNEIITNLVINKKEITQSNIDNVKNYALKNLINKSIKKIEINKFKIDKYNKNDLYRYIDTTAKNFNTNRKGLRQIFRENDINYDLFVENYEIELLWNTLIYQVYNKQININILAVENEIEKLKISENLEYNLSEIEIPIYQYKKNKFKEIFIVIKNEGFEVAAKKFSVSSTAMSGGLVGWVSDRSLSSQYMEKLKKINTQEVSEPIINETSAVILKINKLKKDNDNFDANLVRNNILLKKKEQKLDLFSRSHFSNLENTITINFL
ncbi:peptidylprolyl isomerase [Pelagibacteraceae bacterium]|nr:peptidylprolyl isomerase [Pelagibacteraceae bacterium]